jgi:hypothetical protein
MSAFSLSLITVPAAGCTFQATAYQHQLFSFLVSTTILDLTILEFNSWTVNFKK